MACNNCYNGCVETISDKCVKYTGLDVASLSIENGDSLFVVEQALINAVVSFLNGTGIKITISPSAYCALVVGYLPVSPTVTTPTAVQLFEALVKAACSLQAQVTLNTEELADLNSEYYLQCLSGEFSSTDTHGVLQAVIDKLCDFGVDLSALALDVDTNYVKLSDLDTLIQSYLDSIGTSSKYYNRMVPYTAVEYYGTISNFDGTGAGLGDWEKIYLCNGQNSTPDKRGRVPVGAIQLVPGGTLNAAVNPATPGNPNYAVLDTTGANTIVLDTTQIPSHTHVPTDPGHYHFEFANVVNTTDVPVDATNYVARALNLDPSSNLEYAMNTTPTVPTLGRSSLGTTGISIGSTGDGLGHANIQPVLACYYVMYIP